MRSYIFPAISEYDQSLSSLDNPDYIDMPTNSYNNVFFIKL